jgi:thimet oligopeptidase
MKLMIFFRLTSLFALVGVFVIGIIVFEQVGKAHMNCTVSRAQDIPYLFPRSIDEINERLFTCRQEITQIVEGIIALSDSEYTLENTLQAFDRISWYYTVLMAPVQITEMVSSSQEMRHAAHEAMASMQASVVDLVHSNVRLYRSIKRFQELYAIQLTQEQVYFLQETIKDFERSGLGLPADQLEKVRVLQKELSMLSLDFEKNIATHACALPVTYDELAGLDESFIKQLARDDQGKYILGCDYPTVTMVMDYCAVASTRKKIYLAFNNRAYPVNMDVLNVMIAKRDELAHILGFESYAAYELDSQMVKSVERAELFLDELTIAAQKKAHQEIVELTKQLPKSVVFAPDDRLYPWDVAFVKAAYKREHLKLDERMVAEYFPLDHTIEQVLHIYEQFLGLTFKRVSVGQLWDDEVISIEAYDAHTHQLLGFLLLDLFPRPNKFTHACQLTVVPAVKKRSEKDTECPAVALVIANLPKPTSEKPALLTYNDVITFFHEFGHSMHALLGRTDFVSVSGTNTKMDFVEMPSQMLEGWMRDFNILKSLGRHYKTGLAMPDDLINSLVSLERFDSGISTVRQIYYAHLSLAFFASGAHKNTQAIAQELYQKLIDYAEWENDSHMQASFGHLTDYGSRYYGYLWSKVFAIDLLDTIKNHGLLNAEIGKKYSTSVIGCGGSKDPNSILKDFLGRAPSQEPFMHDLGFK